MKKDTIFIDCFNTILCRTKTPNDVVYDWAKAMNLRFGQIDVPQFFRLFKKAEKRLGELNKLECGDQEFTFDEMIEYVYHELDFYGKLERVDFNQFKNIYTEEYVFAEHNTHYINKRIEKYLAKKKAKGFKIYIVSDFYCDKSFIKNWIESCKDSHVMDYVDDIFVSCQFKKSKRRGTLYQHLLKNLKLNTKKVKMVGDNIHSDFFVALKNGLSVKKVKPQIKLDCKEVRKLKKKLIIPKEYIDIFDNDNDRLMYSNYAFPLYTFTKRLAGMCERRKIKNLFFLSREGRILKKLFDYYIQLHNMSIKTHYISVSRASVMGATLKPLGEENFNYILKNVFISPINFLISLGLSDEEIERILKDAKIEKPKKFYFNLKNSKALKLIFDSEAFKEIYETHRQGQILGFQKYLDSFGVDFKNEGMYVVDVGWNGSVQNFIGEFLGKDVKVEGYYLGMCRKNVACVENNKKYGFLYSEELRKKHLSHKIYQYRKFNYEQVLRSSEPRCDGYSAELGEPIFDKKVDENKIFDDVIGVWQNLIYEKFKKIAMTDREVMSPIDSICLKMFYQMIKKSTKKDMKYFLQAQNTHYDAFIRVGYTLNFNDFMKKIYFKTRDINFTCLYHHKLNKKRTWWE